MIAEVILKQGRYHLVVRGMYVATEGDPCRDPFTIAEHWDKTLLEYAAEMINSSKYKNADDRWRKDTRSP